MWLELVTKMNETDVFSYCDDLHTGETEPPFYYQVVTEASRPKFGYSILYRGGPPGPIGRPGY